MDVRRGVRRRGHGKRRIREAAEAEERAFYERRAPPEYKGAIKPIGTDASSRTSRTRRNLIVVFERAYRRPRRHEGQALLRQGVGRDRRRVPARRAARRRLDALTHSPSPMGFLAEILERPENERPFILIPVGYPAEGSPVPDIVRKPVDEILVER